MSPEFHGSSKHEPSKLYSLEPSTIRGFAERTENEALLEKFQFIMAERALGNEFDIEAQDLAIFIDQKLKSIRQKKQNEKDRIEARVEELVTKDFYEAREFFEVYPQFFLPDDPELEADEDARIALFKNR